MSTHSRDDSTGVAAESLDFGDHDAPSEAELEAGRKLFAQDCRFLLGAAQLAQIPATTCPEIAFAGRSNVGKSSLINALTGRSGLARTSNTPGRTQQINFFDLTGRLTIADLPGHGFAKAPKGIVRNWQRLIDAYLRGRAPLRRVCLLVDSRHGLKDVDHQVMDLLDRDAVIYQAVLTKADKVAATALAACQEAVAEALSRRPAAHPQVIATSAQDGTGIATLRADLAKLALPALG